MTREADLHSIFADPPSESEMKAYLLTVAESKPDSHWLRFRYGVSPASVLHDLVIQWPYPATQNKNRNTWSATAEALSSYDQLYKVLPSNLCQATNSNQPVRTFEYGESDFARITALADAFLKHWTTRDTPLCINSKQHCSCSSSATQKDCEQRLAHIVSDLHTRCEQVRNQAETTGKATSYVGPPLGISTDHFLQHAAEHQKHVFLPVDPVLFTFQSWPERRFSGSFDDLRKHYLERNGTIIVYVLKPGPAPQESDAIWWFSGESRYRAQMERLVRLNPKIADGIVWFVPTETPPNMRHLDALFPSPSSLPSTWERALKQVFAERESWSYTATIDKDAVLDNTGFSAGHVAFSVSPIGAKKFYGRYGSPVIPVDDCEEDKVIRPLIADFFSAALDLRPLQLATGWEKLSVWQFLGRPERRGRGSPSS